MHHDLELVSHYLCPYVQRAIIALTEKYIPHTRNYIDLADKPDWFRAISPLGKVPILRVMVRAGGEFILFESAVICEYLEDTQPNPLHPADPLERARHRSWIEFASATLDAVAGFYNAKDVSAFEEKKAKLRDKFTLLERHLGDGPYFAGIRFSLVDAAFAPLFRYFDTFDRIGDFGFFDGLPRVRAYRASLLKRPSVQDAVVHDYDTRLMEFLARRESHFSHSIVANAA